MKDTSLSFCKILDPTSDLHIYNGPSSMEAMCECVYVLGKGKHQRCYCNKDAVRRAFTGKAHEDQLW